MMKRCEGTDEIDAWAERTFGKHTPDTRQKRMRNGLQREHGRLEFDKLFGGGRRDDSLQNLHCGHEL